MIRINRQTKRIARWLSLPNARAELSNLSDRTLQDIGLVRYQPALEACKPFWLA